MEELELLRPQCSHGRTPQGAGHQHWRRCLSWPLQGPICGARATSESVGIHMARAEGSSGHSPQYQPCSQECSPGTTMHLPL